MEHSIGSIVPKRPPANALQKGTQPEVVSIDVVHCPIYEFKKFQLSQPNL